MKLLLIWFFCVFPLISLGIVIPNKASTVCQQISVNTNDTDCFVDLTVAIDMSAAMGSIANIATLTNSILHTLLPQFNFNQTFVAGISFGAAFSTSPSYFNNYGDMCSWTDTVQSGITELGLADTDLMETFQNYNDKFFRNGRSYKKVFVLLTAISDNAKIQAVQNYAQDLRDGGVYIIVGALGPLAPSSNLYQLGSLTFNSTDFTVPSDNVTNDVCQFGGITINPATQAQTQAHTQAPGTTVTPTDPRSNAIGTPCSTNVSNAWLDIVFVIDVSSAMDSDDIGKLQIELSGFMDGFTIAQTGDHTTRIGIVTYAKTATVQYQLTSFASSSDFYQAVTQLPSFSESDVGDVDTELGLQTAYDLVKKKVKNERGIVIIAAAYNEQGLNGARQLSKTIQEDGITVMTINFNADGISNDLLGTIASPGYSYHADQDDIYDAFPRGLTEINCICPNATVQMRLYDAHSETYTKYKDCLYGSTIAGRPSDIIRIHCPKGGMLASVTSQNKLDFITDNLIPDKSQLNRTKQFIVGGHKSGTQWMWYDTDGSEFPFGNFPVINVNSPSDQYSFYNNTAGFRFDLESSGNIPHKYVCEIKACDADKIC